MHLAKAMSVFFMPFDLAISCLALAEGAYASNLFTKDC